jgi:hypothetical protein
MHVETYQKEFPQKGNAFCGGIQKGEGKGIFPSETDSKVIFEGHEINLLSCP